ncbi:hypothetical protein F66182_5932 [Fusarium sp. NRRL 66182]|nr:hypothetical protein F66182_5932 [Fusarium sp. NRRL 66182]
MPRIPRVGGLKSLQSAVAPVTRTSFIVRAALSTSTPVHAVGDKTKWIRKQLWKGEAPGPEDPYNQRPEPVESNLPEEALETRADRIPTAVQHTRLVLPPRHSEAMTEDEIEAAYPSYTPATTIDGLEEIEPAKTWWDQPGHWGEESEFRGFGGQDRVKDRAVLEVYLRQAVVEALSLQEQGVIEKWAVKKWPVIEKAELDHTLSVNIKVTEEGKATLKGDASTVARRLRAKPKESEDAAVVSVEEAQQIVKTWDPSWQTVSLNDHLKFAIRKRFYQLTGHLIPDVKLGAARTAEDFLTMTLTPTKRGKKLAEILEAHETLPTLTNVKVHSKRITPIDREVSVGRWKVIEEELRKRDLPATGAEGYGKNMERHWLTGKA